jgi:F-type H+-transporting ATPase subunit epsilon
MNKFHFRFITPQGKFYDAPVESILVRGSEGELVVMAGHVPVITRTQKGVVRVRDAGQEKCFTAGEGVLEINETHSVLFLCDDASPVNA